MALIIRPKVTSAAAASWASGITAPATKGHALFINTVLIALVRAAIRPARVAASAGGWYIWTISQHLI